MEKVVASGAFKIVAMAPRKFLKKTLVNQRGWSSWGNSS